MTLLDKLRCWIGLHKYEWSPYLLTTGFSAYQQGVCLRCSKATRRLVGPASDVEYRTAMRSHQKVRS